MINVNLQLHKNYNIINLESQDESTKLIEHKLGFIHLLFKYYIHLLGFAGILSITICDLYYGFTDSSCSKQEPIELTINLKLYLLLSGFVSVVEMLLFFNFVNILHRNDRENTNLCLICFGVVVLLIISLFTFIWNLLGAIVFWKYIYKNGNCDKTFSIYVFISLIIKFIYALVSIVYNLKKCDNK